MVLKRPVATGVQRAAARFADEVSANRKPT